MTKYSSVEIRAVANGYVCFCELHSPAEFRSGERIFVFEKWDDLCAFIKENVGLNTKYWENAPE